MVTADEIFERLEREFVLSPAAEPRGSAPAELFQVDGGPGHGRRHRLGHPPVLRRLRPGPADRRRPGPQLPVRPRGVRPARRAARRRLRRGPRRALGGRDARQAGRARHRRPDVPPAGPADVGHRRLTRSVRGAVGVRDDVLEEPPRAQEVTQRGPVLVAGQPGLAPVRGVQLRVVPEQRPGRGLLTALGRADVGPGGGGASVSVTGSSGASNGNGAGQPRGKPSGTIANWDGGDPARAGDSVTRQSQVKWFRVRRVLRIPRRGQLRADRNRRPAARIRRISCRCCSPSPRRRTAAAQRRHDEHPAQPAVRPGRR